MDESGFAAAGKCTQAEQAEAEQRAGCRFRNHVQVVQRTVYRVRKIPTYFVVRT